MALATNIQAHWKFDESSGDATDSKNGNTAVNTSVTYGTGKLNNCAIYNGSAYHTVADHSTIKPTSDISISLWVNITSTSSYQMLLAKGENAGDTRSYEVRCYGTTTQLEMQLRVGGGSYVQFRSTTALTTGTWYHVLFTRTGTTNAIYINGIQETLAGNTTASGNIDYSTDSLWFGQRNGTLRFNGKLDEVSLFNVALTADNARELFNSGRANAYPHTDTPSLYGAVASYNLDESSGNPQNSVSSLYNMTNVGTMPFGTAKINNGILPDGTNRMVAVQSNALGFSKGSQNYSWNFWVKASSWTTYVTQMTTNAGGGLNALTYGDSAGHLKLHVGGNELTSSTLSTATWYMVTIVKTGTTYEMFINTTSQGTVAEGANAATSNTFALGCNTNDGGITVAGSPLPSGSAMDMASVFQRSINSTEIGVLYASGSALAYPWSTSVNVTVSATVQTATFTIPTYTPTATQNVTVSQGTPPNATFSIPTYSQVSSVTVNPSVKTATFSIPTYTVVADGGVVVSPAVKTSTFSIPSYSVSTSLMVIENLQVCTFSIPTYTVTIITGVTVTPSVQVATFSIPTYRIIADYWEDKFTQPANAWSNKFTQPANGWNDKY